MEVLNLYCTQNYTNNVLNSPEIFYHSTWHDDFIYLNVCNLKNVELRFDHLQIRYGNK